MTEVASQTARSTHLLKIFLFILLFASVFSFSSRHLLSISTSASVCTSWYTHHLLDTADSCSHNDAVKWCELLHENVEALQSHGHSSALLLQPLLPFSTFPSTNRNLPLACISVSIKIHRNTRYCVRPRASLNFTVVC